MKTQNLKFNTNIAIFTLICVLLGFIVVFSLKANNSTDTSSEETQYQTLINYVKTLEKETAALEEEIILTRDKIEVIQQNQSGEQDKLANLRTVLDEMNILAGYTEVYGPGIVITLDDNVKGAEMAKKNSPATFYPEDYIIHDKNLLYIIKALAQNSEAVSINGQRIVDSSNIRCVGTLIMVNSSRLAPPYEIKIIGNKDLLETDFLNCEEYLALKVRNMPVKLEKKDNIIISAYTGGYNLDYMKKTNQ